jgi:hypothetical protein
MPARLREVGKAGDLGARISRNGGSESYAYLAFLKLIK